MTSLFDPKQLSDDQLTQCIYEMRRRTWSVVAYDEAELRMMCEDDEELNVEKIIKWQKEHQHEIEDDLHFAFRRVIEYVSKDDKIK